MGRCDCESCETRKAGRGMPAGWNLIHVGDELYLEGPDPKEVVVDMCDGEIMFDFNSEQNPPHAISGRNSIVVPIDALKALLERAGEIR
jgi:hypothetical protein